ncbi:hypothetical protein NP493_1571g00023 [Ridgeia piscesae]|uniref:Uncharacterized protein n=1 Tax=Ridgeia piscesae TaxID=27915 RepID=A0AAD9NB16_RIDPI|nr:hypothetical protein NP493_1571g00023 [Ridgeia piscesae]
MSCGSKKLLVIMTSVCACASFAFLCIAVATDYWLYAKERVFDANQSATYMKTFTGLWRKCVEDGRWRGLVLRGRWEGGLSQCMRR